MWLISYLGMITLAGLAGNVIGQNPCGIVNVTLDEFKIRIFTVSSPGGFEDGVSCSWTITASATGNAILYQLRNLQLGADDLLNVYDGTTESGTNINSNVTGMDSSTGLGSTTSNSVHITFKSGNQKVSREKGFTIYVMAGVDKSGMTCFEEVLRATEEPHFLTSPQFPSTYPTSNKCSWSIEAPEGATLEVTFRLIDIESSDNCTYDSLVLYTPGNKNSPVLRLCRTGDWEMTTYYVKNNILKVDFVADESDSYAGFVFSYLAVLPPSTQSPTTTSIPETSTFTTLPTSTQTTSSAATPDTTKDSVIPLSTQSPTSASLPETSTFTTLPTSTQATTSAATPDTTKDPAYLKAVCSKCQSRICTFGIPDDCGAYVVCEAGHKSSQMRCPFGTFFDGRESCDFPSVVKCPNDPCSDPKYPNLDSYQDFHTKEPNCRSYWICNGKYSTARCCPEGTAYHGEGACVKDPSCNATYTCPLEETMPKEGCYLKSDDGITFYHELSVSQKLYCPKGTVFDSELCTCVSSGRIAPTCELEVHITFDDTSVPDIKNQAKYPVYIAPRAIEKLNGYVKFLGGGSITIPFYAGNDNLSRMFEIQLKLFALSRSPRKQVLLTNCVVDTFQNPFVSFEIYLTNRRSRSFINIRIINTDGSTTRMKLPVKLRDWTKVLFQFDGTYLRGALWHINNKGRIETEESVVRYLGNMMNTGGPLKIGGCTEYKDGIYGYMDDIKISFCIATMIQGSTI